MLADDEILFPPGTIARNNRTDEKFVIDKPLRGRKEREGVYRLEYYQGDSHWVFLSDNQPLSESEVEVKMWMEKALDIKDYRGGRGDRIAMLKVLINDGELGKVTQRSDVYAMALALARNLGYSMPPASGKSWERHFAEQIANELGIEVRIIKNSVVIKPARHLEALREQVIMPVVSDEFQAEVERREDEIVDARDDAMSLKEFHPLEQSEIEEELEKKSRLDKPVWQIDASVYLSKIGVHEPWIAEIAPSQYARLSERGKREYDKKRSMEWQASIDAKEEWRRKVIEAFDRGEFTLESPGLSKEAENAVYYELQRRKQAVEAEKARRASDENQVKSMDELREGDRLYDVIYACYVTVLRKFKNQVRVRDDQGFEYPVHLFRLRWLWGGDFERAVKEGLPIKPVRSEIQMAKGETALLSKAVIPEKPGLYYQAALEPSKAQVKFAAPPVTRPQFLGVEGEKPAKKVERKVEPGLARFGVHRPEELPLEVYLQKIEFEKRKRELEGK